VKGAQLTAWVAGEVLIDMLKSNEEFHPLVGGGPANTAKALASLGVAVSFICGISYDEFGSKIESNLLSQGVDLKLIHRSTLPTAVARVILEDNSSPRYEFELTGTASFNFSDWLPRGNPPVLYIGSLAAILEPGASALFKWASRLDTRIVYDPNVRTNVFGERKIYKEYFEKWASLSYVVKLSDEDLEWIDFNINEIFDLGVTLVVLTQGNLGISAFSRKWQVHVPAEVVRVVDTIGAGDTVGAILVEALVNEIELTEESMRGVLKRAARAAAITCSKVGAQPPSKWELT